MDVQITALTSGGAAAANAVGTVQLLTGGTYAGPVGGAVTGGPEPFELDEDGLHTLELTPNSEYDIEGTIYVVRIPALKLKIYFEVPATGGPYDLGDTSIWTVSTPPALIVPQPTVGEGGLTEADVAEVALSGAYSDLSGTPTLGTAAAQPVSAFDAAGAATAAQAAAISAASTDATTKANAAQAAAIQRANHTGSQAQSTVTNLVSDLAAKETPAGAQAKADAAQAAAESHADDEVAALLEPGDGVGTKRVNDSGIDRVNVSTVRASVIGTGVGNTTTETTLLTTPIAFAAGALSIDSVIRVVAFGQFSNNTGANRDTTFRLKFGSHNAYVWAFTAITTSATERRWEVQADIGFFDFFGNRCQGSGRATISAAGAGLDFGTITRFADTTTVVTPASASTVDLTVQHSTNLSTLNATIVGMRYQLLTAA
jgi:hypothetical protein